MGLSLISTQSGGPIGAKPDLPPASTGQPRPFGDYELVNEIARGGMGVVYRARQISLNRIVAVKVLLFGQFASDAFVKRFRAEAEAAASLRHTNIVGIYEVGEHEGQHYFSMELVEGPSLAQVARDQPLPARQAAQYLKTIAEAVDYAHQRGVLHRDLKPSNVLIDPGGQPRITDFGLAKRLSNSEFGTRNSELTVTGQMLGSPNYMPPEQADPKRGSASPASDVYSLGAILYQLLTGRPPFLAETLEQTLAQLLHRDPVAPRLLNPAIPRDLETICVRCLEKESARRYATAGQLADELGRFLRDEPILARPAGPPEKLWRWCRREPLVAGLAFGLAAALVGGLGITNLLLWREREAGRRASQAEQLQSQLRSRAETERESATVEAAKSRQLAEFLRRTLERAGPSASLGRDTTLLREILDQTAARIDHELTNQPSVMAEMRDTLGRTYYDIGDAKKAIEMHREALRLRHELGEAEALGGAQSTHLLAQALAENGDLDEAESLNFQALALWKKLRGPEDPKVASSLNNLGNVYFRRRDLDRAKEYFEQALAIYRQTDDPNTSAPLHNLANVLALQNHFAAAEKLYREAVTLARQRHGDLHPTTALYLRNLGDVLRAQGKLEEAAAAHGEALTTRANLLDELHPLLTDSLERLAVVKVQQGQLAEAEILYRKALAARRKQTDDPRKWDEDANELANILNQQQRFGETEQLLSELIAVTGEKDPRAARLYAIRGSARGRHGSWKEAALDLAQSHRLAPENTWSAFLLAVTQVESNDRLAYRSLCQEMLQRYETSQGETAYMIALLALLTADSGANAETVNELMERALLAIGSNPNYVALKALAECRASQAAAAVDRLEALLNDLANRRIQGGRFNQVQIHAILAIAHHSLGHPKEARLALEQARTVAPVKIEVPANGDYGSRWQEWLILQCHLRQATALIEGDKP
jgi:serine/threonine protein kinase/Tfp pilus assembly protein PilF